MAGAGFVVWFTGLSGSGKSTLATRLAAELLTLGESVELLDGDEVRAHLSKGLGFSRADRDTNVLRIGFVARLLARHGACAITAAISPYRAAREEVRQRADRFLEVWCRAPIDALAARDPKGLYQRALRGEITGFTGIDDPYEEPLAAEVVCDTADEDVETSLRRILDALVVRGWIGQHGIGHAGGGAPGRTDALDAMPHGGVLEERAAPAASRDQLAAEARGMVTLPVGGAVEDVLDAFATGLLSPLRGFTTQREDHAIVHGRRLERGIAWPTRIRLTAPDEHPAAGATAGTSIALQGRESGARAVVDVAETFRLEPRVIEIAGEVTVLQVGDGVTFASDLRRRLAAAGHRRVLGHVVRGGVVDAALIRAGLLLHDAMILGCPGPVIDLAALDLRPEERRRVWVARIARLPARGATDAVLEAIALKNLGASTALVDPVPFASPGDADAERAVREVLASFGRAALGIDVAVLSSAEHDARRAIEAAAPGPLPVELLDQVVAAHRVGRRAYHDLAHVAAVVRHLVEEARRPPGGGDGAEPPAVPRETFLAALFHDAIYEAGRGDNEARSAALAQEAIERWMPDAGVDVERVSRLIRLTARHGHLDGDGLDDQAKAFVDADMAILAEPVDVFDRYDRAVAWEYAAAVSPEAWAAGRKRFLEGLLAAPRIFLGEDTHARLDARARENLRRALSSC